MSISSMVKRGRSIHQVSLAKISMIPDTNLTTPSAANFDNDEGSCFLAAVMQYSTDAPLRQVTLAQGNIQVWQYDLTVLIPGWTDRFGVEMIQYPMDMPELNFMNDNAWDQSIDPATGHANLWFNSNFPGGNTYSSQYPAGSFGIWYMRPHVLDTTTNTTTIPDYHEEAVSQEFAALFLELAANKAAQFSDQQILANKDMGGLAGRLQGQADKAHAAYTKLIDKDAVAFQPQWVDWEVEGTLGWMPFHPSRSSLSR